MALERPRVGSMYRHRVRSVLPPDQQSEEKARDPHLVHALHQSEHNRELLQLLALVAGDSAMCALTTMEDEIVTSGNLTTEKGDLIENGTLVKVQGSRDDVILCLMDAHQEELVVELLISTAVKSRMRLDWWAAPENRGTIGGSPRFLGYADVCVGQLKKGDDDWVPMSLREGCNKIIHGERFAFPCHNVGGFIALTGDVELDGKRQNGEPWNARLNVPKYVRASIYTAYGGFDFPRGWMQRR